MTRRAPFVTQRLDKHPVQGANQPNVVTHGDRKSQQKGHEKFGLLADPF